MQLGNDLCAAFDRWENEGGAPYRSTRLSTAAANRDRSSHATRMQTQPATDGINPIGRPAIVVLRKDYENLSSLLNAAEQTDPTVARFLREELGRADIADGELPSASLVTMGSEVRFIEHSPATIRQVRLVFPGDERDSCDVSVLTATGSALIGLGPGQSISWNEDGTERRLTVLEVLVRGRRKH